MINNKNKTTAIVLGIFALVIVTTAASFAFFTYSRVGNTTTTITSGDIEFTYKEGEDASLANAFPVSDSVGANDTSEEYTFTVNLKSTSASNKMNYNVYLLDANDDANTNYFTNEQIKFALIKDNVFVAGTSTTEGKKLSSVAGFTAGEHEGEGLVLESQEIAAGKTDEYKLRIWISDDINYSNTDRVDDDTDEFNDSQTSIGKYNGYKYSLKVKVTSGIAVTNSITISNLVVNNKTMTADLSDINGLDSYAVTTSQTAPVDGSSEWITITNESAKSNVQRTANGLITSKTISYTVPSNGTYYLHVKNKLNQTSKKEFVVNVTGELATTKIKNLAATNTNELRIDTHEATGQQTFATTEYRYYGATPNNYVEFNNELWRIIGVFKVDDGTGNIEERLKIIRANPIGKYSWDSSDANTNKGYGVNEWNQADLMTLLNSGEYYNRTSGNCYNAKENGTTSCDFTQTGLTSEAKEMIGNAKWYLGAGPETYSSLTSSDFYGYERGSDSGKQCSNTGTYADYCNDSVTRKPFWVGQVGLMYPSDYGYSANMNSCSSTGLNDYNTSCKDTSWLYNSANYQWTLSPRPDLLNPYSVFFVNWSGVLGSSNTITAHDASPVTYLKSDIKIVDGIGTDKQPFILSK